MEIIKRAYEGTKKEYELKIKSAIESLDRFRSQEILDKYKNVNINLEDRCLGAYSILDIKYI
ncbi:hypothetical protein [Terrisporobacter sp.]